MASEIRGFTDPASMQAFGNLVSGEQMYDQMAAAAAQNRGNAMLAQQQMAQEYDLAQQRMAQGQQQFEAGLLEAGREREFRTSERLAGEKFASNEAAEARKWEDTKTNKLRAFELELQELDIQAEEARAKGLTDVVRAIEERKRAVRVERAKMSMELSQYQMVAGQTATKARQRMLDFNSRLKQELSAYQAKQSAGSGFSTALVNGLSTRAKDESTSAISGLRGAQWGDVYGQSARDLGAALTAAGAGDLPGSEFLILDSDQFATMKSLSPGQTITSSFVKGEVDPADMTRRIQDRVFSSSIEALKGMGIKDEKSAMDAMRLAATGGDKSEIARKLVASGIDPTTLKAMFENAAEQLDKDGRVRLDGLSTKYRSESGGQDSMEIRAIGMAQKALESQISTLRGMSSRIDVSDQLDLQTAIDMLEARIRTGELGGLPEDQLLRAVGGDRSRVKDLLDSLSEAEAAASTASKAAVSLGDLAETEADDEGLNVLRMLLAGQAGSADRRKGLQKIREGLSR